jgi:hypothetical protein
MLPAVCRCVVKLVIYHILRYEYTTRFDLGRYPIPGAVKAPNYLPKGSANP